MGLKGQFWYLVDNNLRRIGLERISQRPIKKLTIHDGIVKIEFRNGFRWTGRHDWLFLNRILVPSNPLLEEETADASAPE